MNAKRKSTPKRKAKKADAKALPATIPNRSGTPKATVTLPPISTIIDARQSEQISTLESVVRMRDWFRVYFTQVFRTYTRKEVGKRISPGDWHMQTALDMLPAGARELPPSERGACFFPLEVLLRAIADAWEDAAAPALSALHHWGEVKQFYVRNYNDKPLPIETATATIKELNTNIQGTKKSLNDLSSQLLKANPDESEQTLAEIKTTLEKLPGAILESVGRTQTTFNERFDGVEEKIDAAARDAHAAAENTAIVPDLLPTIKTGIDGLYPTPKPNPINETARRAIVDMWKDFRAGKLDAQFDGKRTFQTFLDVCGNLNAYAKPDGTILTVNDCLPCGEEQLRNLIHTENQKRHTERKMSKAHTGRKSSIKK